MQMHGAVFLHPRTPALVDQPPDHREAAVKILREIRPDSTQSDLEATADEIARASSERHMTARFWTKHLRFTILLAFLIVFFNQLSGINNIIYFAPRLLGLAGMHDPDKAAILPGATNLVFTLTGLC